MRFKRADNTAGAVLAGLLRLAVPALRAAEPANPLDTLLTASAVRADRAYIQSLQELLENAARSGLSPTSFNFARAQAWLDFASEQFNEKDSGCVVKEALRQAQRDIRSVYSSTEDLRAPGPLGCPFPKPYRAGKPAQDNKRVQAAGLAGEGKPPVSAAGASGAAASAQTGGGIPENSGQGAAPGKAAPEVKSIGGESSKAPE